MTSPGSILTLAAGSRASSRLATDTWPVTYFPEGVGFTAAGNGVGLSAGLVKLITGPASVRRPPASDSISSRDFCPSACSTPGLLTEPNTDTALLLYSTELTETCGSR